jgi:small subunit ribosomal protein S6
MRHYEIVLLIHPDQSEQVPAMLERYKGVVAAGGGKVLECGQEVLTELETGFRFNDAVLRHLTVLKDQAETAPSVMMKAVEREDSRKAPQQQAQEASA